MSNRIGTMGGSLAAIAALLENRMIEDHAEEVREHALVLLARNFEHDEDFRTLAGRIADEDRSSRLRRLATAILQENR